MREEEIISIQCQATQTSCVSTCVAMLLNIPQQFVIEEFDAGYHERKYQLNYILDYFGIEYRADFRVIDATAITDIDINCVAFLTVPSLNYPGGLHQILAEYDAEDMLWRIYDPQKGTEYKYYEAGNNEEDPNSFPMRSYFLDCVITLEEVARIRELHKEWH